VAVKESWRGAGGSIYLALLVPTVVLSAVLSVLYLFMKLSVNLDPPKEKQLSWWSKDYFVVERTYAEQNPERVLPQLSRAGLCLIIALGIAAAVARFWVF
jgi:hypothetical protein